MKYPILQPTGPSVTKAILDTEVLSKAISGDRRQTMLALIAIAPATDHSRLLAQLVFGLERPLEDHRPPAEIARQQRVTALLGDIAAAPEGRPAYQSGQDFEFAAAVSLKAGNDVADGLAMHFETFLRQKVLTSLDDVPCSEELVANSSYGGSVVIELLNKVSHEKFIIPDIQLRILSNGRHSRAKFQGA